MGFYTVIGDFMWKAQLKVGSKTFTMPKVKLTVDPDEDKCCEKARQKFIGMYYDIQPSTLKILTNWPCKKLKKYLTKFAASDAVAEWRENQQKILDEWEECERVEEST